MSGPGLGVLTAIEPTAAEEIVVATIRAAGYTFALDPEPDYFRDSWGLPHAYAVESAADTIELEPDTVAALEIATGMPIRTDISVLSFVSDLRCRPPLAQLALRIAEATDGWVDVDGDIARPYGRAPIIGLDDYFNQYGRCVFVDGGYFLDRAAMAAWLRHPDFYVVK